MTEPIIVERDDLARDAVRTLLREHLADMATATPPESIHALDLDGLRGRDVTVWTAWGADEPLGFGALKQLDATHGEIKSMRTVAAARGRGIGARMLVHLLGEARRRGYRRLSLETGSGTFFAPARRLYARYGFTGRPPFGAYGPDPNSVFMTLPL